jgi:hypothetical protein
MDQRTGVRIGEVALAYAAWLTLLVAAGALLLRGDDLAAVGVLPWFVAVFAAMAGSDRLEHLRREQVGRFVARLAFVFMGVLLVVALAAGPPSYLAVLGQRGKAVVTEIESELAEPFHRCRVSLAATGEDLGWFPPEQCGLRVPGDGIEVSYDPRGWVVPTAGALPAGRTGAMVLVAWLLVATGTAASAVTVTALDPPGQNPAVPPR